MQDIHWICQERETEKPWAMQLFHVYSRRKMSTQLLVGVLYSEQIDNRTHSVLIEIDADREIDDILRALCHDMGRYVEVTKDDRDQLKTAFGDILSL